MRPKEQNVQLTPQFLCFMGGSNLQEIKRQGINQCGFALMTRIDVY